MSIEPDLLEKFVPIGTYRNHREIDERVRLGMEERLRSVEKAIVALEKDGEHTEENVKSIVTGGERKNDRLLVLVGLAVSIILGLAGVLHDWIGK